MLNGTHIAGTLFNTRYVLVTICLFYSTANQLFAEPAIERQNEVIHMIEHDCGACHGMTLKGGLGPALTPDRLNNKSFNELFNIISYGVDGQPMPPWKDILTEDEISWIVKQLQSGTLIKQ